MTTAETTPLLAQSAKAADSHRPRFLCDRHLNFVTPPLQRLLTVWDAKREGHPFPNRSAFSLRDLSFILPNLAFVDIVHDGPRLRFMVRLMGAQLDSYVGPMTGKHIDEALPPRIAAKWATIWQGAVETEKAQRSIGQVEIEGKEFYVFEKFCAPLGPNGAPPTMLMVATFYHSLEDKKYGAPGEISARLINELDGTAIPSK